MRSGKHCFVALALSCAFALPAAADPLITNGGFESGLNGWSHLDSTGSNGTFYLQSGTVSPVNRDAVPAPPTGTSAAMTDAQGPGSHLLWQDFSILTTSSQYLLTFNLFIGNRASSFATPVSESLDFNIGEANQQTRVDLMYTSAADPFSVAPSDILLNLYQSSAGDLLVSGYTTITVDITNVVNANLAIPLRLRFAETDNQAALQVGIDDVNIAGTEVSLTPEPSSWTLLAAGCLALLVTRRQRRSV